MKIVAALVIGLFVSLQGLGAENVSVVPFELGPQHFTGDDQIVIEQVMASSPQLAVGNTVTVRGRYVLSSKDGAQLCLYLATTHDVGAEPVLSAQKMEIRKGSGSFELTEVVKHPGHLHLSFYPIQAGRRLGTVYFGTSQQMQEMRNLEIAD
jgi:hypothetical protein